MPAFIQTQFHSSFFKDKYRLTCSWQSYPAAHSQFITYQSWNLRLDLVLNEHPDLAHYWVAQVPVLAQKHHFGTEKE